jgi:Clr5 domain
MDSTTDQESQDRRWMNDTVSHDLITRKKRWAAPEDWEQYRTPIRKLYLEEDMPLKDVMAIMERRHGFYATSVDRSPSFRLF